MIAHALYRARLIEHWGSGTTRIVSACRAGNIEVGFHVDGSCFIVRLRKDRGPRSESRSESDVPARILLGLLAGERSRKELAGILGHKSVTGAARMSVKELLKQGLIEYTIPARPQSRLQKYRLTDKGRHRETLMAHSRLQRPAFPSFRLPPFMVYGLQPWATTSSVIRRPWTARNPMRAPPKTHGRDFACKMLA